MKVRCPLCGAEKEWEGNEQRPFCSLECKSKDLGHWAMQKYQIPGPALTEESGKPVPKIPDEE